MSEDIQRTKALEESIQHWKDNTKAETPHDASTSASACALCVQYSGFWDIENMSGCAGCPIRERTGLPFCESTPYQAADEAHQEWMEQDQYSKSDRQLEWNLAKAKFKAAAEDMVVFLEGLRK